VGNQCVWLPGEAHTRFQTCREAPTRPIRVLGEGAGTGLPVILLCSKIGLRRLGRSCASQFSLPAPETLSGLLWGAGGDALTTFKSFQVLVLFAMFLCKCTWYFLSDLLLSDLTACMVL
jgi:hypothetical protein